MKPIIGGIGYINTSDLNADQQVQVGFACAGVKTTPFAELPTLCPANQLTSQLVHIPPPNTENNDKNPPRIAHRNLFDISLRGDELFEGNRNRFSVRVIAVNVTNKVALYNFPPTLSGTHHVTPHSLTTEIGYHF